MPQETVEQTQKRHRNRIAQQRYRKRLKSHIEDLERRAAVVGCQTNAANCILQDGMTAFSSFSGNLGGGADGSGLSLLPPHGEKPPGLTMCTTNTTPTNTSTATPESFHDRLALNSQGTTLSPSRSGVSLAEEADLIQRYSLTENFSWAGERGMSFQGMNVTDTVVEARESLTSTSKSRHIAPQSASPRTSSSDTLRNSAHPTGSSASDQGNAESRVASVLRTLPTLGFDNVESFLSCYYTTSFADKTPVKAAQEAGRIKGLPHILGELQTKASSWPAWESSGYRDAIIRSAAQLLTDEFERLTKKRYTCEEELHENVARSAHAPVNDERAITNHLFSTAGELKKTLREELPNLHAIIATLADQDSARQQSTRLPLLLATVSILAAPQEEPLKEAVNWVYSRSNGECPPMEDFDNNSVLST